ncbi:UDP-N-acetylmuramoyl-L-alanine--D-glutamate ligase [Candidatus Woesebacteria bacterium]|nr:UDP-N-acetylmuramoyl-L-alanine--D-glutamate ligase [Candidatus Woesebacteria bacterium]
MKHSDLEGKKILIVGYGKEGKTTKAYLESVLSHPNIAVVDAKDGPQYLDAQHEFDIAIRSPSVHPSKLTIPTTTATNIFFANCENMIIGVTGSKGKSTSTSLIHHFLSHAGKDARLVGNIGTPALSELLKPYSPETIFVMELSSYQLMDCVYSPHIAVVTTLFPEHMNFHGSVEKYYEAKKHIIIHQAVEDYYIFNPQFTQLMQWVKETQATSIPEKKFDVDMQLTPLKGEHNLHNIRLALTACEILGIDAKQAMTHLGTFQPLPHRLEFIGTYHDIDFYDDAISTTPESTMAALNTLQFVGTLFLGGEDRGYDFRTLVKELHVLEIGAIVLFPDSGTKIKELIEKEEGYNPRMLVTDSMHDAVAFAYEHTPQGSICLLSTASPSYSIWKNFEEKGDMFAEEVKRLGSKTNNEKFTTNN